MVHKRAKFRGAQAITACSFKVVEHETIPDTYDPHVRDNADVQCTVPDKREAATEERGGKP